MKKRSLSQKLLLGLGLLSLAGTALVAVGGFLAFRQELVNRQIMFLDEYVRERSRNIDRRFSNLNALQTAAGEELGRRIAALDPKTVDRLMDELYPDHGDGTRRSRPESFDGHRDASGRYTYGVGAFLGDAAHMTAEERAAFVAAFGIVADFGQASHSDYDNFYFFTPPKTRLVMYGPDRPDRLMFYRHDAPPTLDVSHQAMSTMTLPAADPQRLTRCTDLQHLVQDVHGKRLGTACLTPVYVKGRYIGAFGSSINLTGFFLSAVRNTLPGAESIVATNKGGLITASTFSSREPPPDRVIDAYASRMGLRPILEALKRSGKDSGVMLSPDGTQIVGFSKLNGPDWYLLMLYPKAAVARSAAASASWVLALGLLAWLVQTVLLVLLTRRTVVDPLERLAAGCRVGDAERPPMADIEARPDEIGVLARALSAERAKVEAVLGSLEQRVRERTAELERANAEKSRFLANMSHELRTPLNGVIAVSQTLAKRQTRSEDEELAELIVSSGRLLERVLTDILDFSKIEAGEIRLAEEPFDLADVVGRIAELHRASAEAKGLTLSWSLTDAAAGGYLGDPIRLTQVLSNLLSNAVKFTAEGSVTLTADRRDGDLILTVTDTGIGFDDEVRRRLFRRFEQADSSIRRRFGGAGLGLAISRSLMELMGGTVTAASVPGKGSTFTATAPLARADLAPRAASSAGDGADDDLSLDGVRILLAEDHPTNQKVVELILRPFGVVLDIVDNGARALERLEAAPYDLVLMDMQMPELDGLCATRRLRASEAATGRHRTPVIMLTANAMDEHVRESLAAGADRHIAKPVSPQALLIAIAELLAAAPASASALRALA